MFKFSAMQFSVLISVCVTCGWRMRGEVMSPTWMWNSGRYWWIGWFKFMIDSIELSLASKTTSPEELQLVGISTMLIASKYEEIWAPKVNDLVCISGRSYSNKQVLIMEKQILVRFIVWRRRRRWCIFWRSLIGVMNYSSTIKCSQSSMVAASAVYMGRCTLLSGTRRLSRTTGFSSLCIIFVQPAWPRDLWF